MKQDQERNDGAAVALKLDALDSLPERVSRPSYKRESVSAGILHFGPGNFHRAHQGVYLDTLMNLGIDHDWGIVGASVMPGDAAMRERFIEQDMLTCVVAQSATRNDASVTGVMLDYLMAADSAVILEAMVEPAIRIVSMTVTEGGYFVDAKTGEFNDKHPGILADVQNFHTPRTVFGLIARSLQIRREKGVAAFTVMSCDNLPHNGRVTRQAVIGMARLVDPALAEWIEANSSFPNGMVDRIAPATGERERRMVREEHGVADAIPVFCEDYLQWVLEDAFVAGRPQLEKVGVQFVEDVTPFETMKIRVLNGGHAIIAYASGLLDIEYADAAMQHPLIKAWLDKVEHTEIMPVIPPVPDTDLNAYYDKVVERFSNAKIGDTIRRLCFDGSNRQPKFIVPGVRDRLASEDSVEGLALASALWCRYCYGTTESGVIIEPNDPSWDQLLTTARAAREDPVQWLQMQDVYGDLADDAVFSEAFFRALLAIWSDGTEAVLTRYVES